MNLSSILAKHEFQPKHNEAKLDKNGCGQNHAIFSKPDNGQQNWL